MPEPGSGHGGDDWWQRGVVYHAYLRSFADSDGDGTGDLAGLIAHLDHLNDGTPDSLGVDALLLSPMYPSPGYDVGYDVSDHQDIDPLFGSLADFDRLRGGRPRAGDGRDHRPGHEPHQPPAPVVRGLRARPATGRTPTGTCGGIGVRGRFGRRGPPNNWPSFFGGSAWTWDAGRGQYYLHIFTPEQPDLNWRNPAVPRRHAGHRPVLARSGRGWVPARRVQRVLQGRRAALEPAPLAGRHPGLGPAAPRARQGPAGAPGLPDRFPGAARRHAGAHERGRAVHRRAGRRGALQHATRHLIFDFALCFTPWTGVGAGRHHRRARGGLRSGPLAHRRAVEPRPAAACLAPARGGAIATRWPRRRPSCCSPCAARRSCTTARRSGWATSGAAPRRGPAGAPVLAAPVWRNRDCRGAAALDAAGRTAASRPASPWSRMAPDYPTRNVARQSADPGPRSWPCTGASSRSAIGPRPSRCGRFGWHVRGTDDVLGLAAHGR